ncbi:MAG: sigma-70 family RNA polymerase sigma factor [Actinomycetes bacterium]
MSVDAAAWEAALPGLLRYARTLTGDAEAANDLVQETVARGLDRVDQFRQGSSLATWLHSIMHNLAVDDARRRHEIPSGDLFREAGDREVDDLEAKWRDDGYTVDSSAVIERAETREELRDGLARLPFIYRSAVVLHDAEGLTASELASVQEIGLPAAKQRIRRGRMMLVSALAAGTERREALKGVPMRCWDARAKVSDYLDGDLSANERLILEQHLQACPTCPPLYAGLVGTTAALGAWRDPDDVVPPQVIRRIRTH